LVKWSQLYEIYAEYSHSFRDLTVTYKAMFGNEPRVGLTTRTLPSEVIQNIEDEDELEEVIEQINAE
jgi:hypothetical protein